MKRTMNPRNREGERNIHCPFYRECLDLVIQRAWDNWDCVSCRNFENKRDFYDALPPVDNGLPFYSLSQDINLEAL
jgi:hypothetical protein